MLKARQNEYWLRISILFFLASEVTCRSSEPVTARPTCPGQGKDTCWANLMQLNTQLVVKTRHSHDPDEDFADSQPSTVDNVIATPVLNASGSSSHLLSEGQRSATAARTMDVANDTASDAITHKDDLPTSWWSMMKMFIGDGVWNQALPWYKIQAGHRKHQGPFPDWLLGVSPRTASRSVVWADVPYVSLRVTLCLTLVVYPAIFLLLFLLMALLVSSCVTLRREDSQPVAFVSETSGGGSNIPGGLNMGNPQEEEDAVDAVDDVDGSDRGQGGSSSASTTTSSMGANFGNSLPELSELEPASQVVLWIWMTFCRFVPALLVFGVPFFVLCFAGRYPQEVWSAFRLVSTIFMFSNALYIVSFAAGSIETLRVAMVQDHSQLGVQNEANDEEDPISDESTCAASTSSDDSKPQPLQPVHWVIIPQYCEDKEVLRMTLRSIKRSRIARKSICVVLAMEEREQAARAKAEDLQEQFVGDFAEMLVTYHPADLPNDPAGKASNTAWAFKTLVLHLERSSREDLPSAPVLLTVADADSEFDAQYFECLTNLYSAAGEQRDLRLWQSPIFHLKNYHTQPAPVVVGAVFTTMMELATMSDPHAVRMPYSTYSLSLALAKRVRGWDAEWIAEDWHMGLKCFLSTFGQTKVESIPLPTMNYTPEEDTWTGTVIARWTQAKRHALGLSDLAYYLMNLPIFLSMAYHQASGSPLAKFARTVMMMLKSTQLVLKLVNTHVVLGLLTTYYVIGLTLQILMKLYLTRTDRNVDALLGRTQFFQLSCFGCTVLFFLCSMFLFLKVYGLVKARVEPPASRNWLYRYSVLHGAYLVFCFVVMSVVYFTALGICVMRAAASTMISTTFIYEVASKPSRPSSDVSCACGAPQR